MNQHVSEPSLIPSPDSVRQLSRSSRQAVAQLDTALASIDFAGIAADYGKYNELFWRETLLPKDVLAKVKEEADLVRPRIVRKRVPGYKKSGSVNYFDLMEQAPNILALYKNPALITMLSQLAGAPLLPCPDDDPHAAAIYYYTEDGDGIGWHYDSSHYAGERYTVLIGLVNKTSRAQLICQPYRKINGPELELRLSTNPGMFIFFNGNKIYHSVSPIGPDEERIVLTLEYVTNPHMTPVRRFISNMKDAMTYFGFSSLLKKRRRVAT